MLAALISAQGRCHRSMIGLRMMIMMILMTMKEMAMMVVMVMRIMMTSNVSESLYISRDAS